MSDTRQVVERELLNRLQGQGETLADDAVQMLLQALFLEQADAMVQRLRLHLGNWIAGEVDKPDAVCLRDAENLADLAQERSLHGLAEVARALAHALTRAEANPSEVRSAPLLRGAEEIARLLHQFAAGYIKSPQQSVLDDLR